MRWRRAILTLAIAASCTWCIKVVHTVHNQAGLPAAPTQRINARWAHERPAVLAVTPARESSG